MQRHTNDRYILTKTLSTMQAQLCVPQILKGIIELRLCILQGQLQITFMSTYHTFQVLQLDTLRRLFDPL